jgi:hypothetical protein
MLKEAKTPQRERDPRGKVKNLHLQQNWKKKSKQNRDKDLLTKLPKKTFNLGWDKWEQPIANT